MRRPFKPRGLPGGHGSRRLSRSVASVCPKCSFPIAPGVLRCRSCGADAREPAHAIGVATAFSLWDVAPEQAEVADLLDDLEGESPEVGSWFRRVDWPRRERVIRVLISLRDLPRRG
jgi:hypothetical protein